LCGLAFGRWRSFVLVGLAVTVTSKDLTMKQHDKPFYVYPPRPRRISPTLLESTYSEDEGWIAEKKMNGWRGVVLHDGKTSEIWNRHGAVMATGQGEEEMAKHLANILPGSSTIVDGEMIGRRTTTVKGIFYAFDICMIEGEWIGDRTYLERRKVLQTLLASHQGDKLWLPTYVNRGKFDYFKDSIGDELSEGIVIKRANSTFPMELNSESSKFTGWLKVKKEDAQFLPGYYEKKGGGTDLDIGDMV